jgi:hypothetical protein
MTSPHEDDRTIQSTQDAAEAAQDAARRTGEEFRKTAADNTRKTADSAAAFGRSTLAAGEHAARTGTEIMQHNAEVMRKAWHSYLDFAAQMTGRSGEELARTFPIAPLISGEEARKTSEQSSRNVDAIVDSSTALAKGVEDITREWFDFARGRVEGNLATLSEFTRCRSPQHVAALQSKMMRDNLEVLLQVSHKVAGISVRVAEDAMGKVADAADKAEQTGQAA